MKRKQEPTFADSLVQNRARKIKKTFFSQINTIIDWQPIEEVINKYDNRDEKAQYTGLLLFKMLLLQNWYGLSDYEVEDRVNDSISFSYFCGLNIDEVAPDNSTLSRFRTAMTTAKVFDKLFKEINKQLESHNIIIKKGAIVDASVIPTPFKPKGKPKHKIAKDRETEEPILEKDIPQSVDKDASYLKKGDKIYYGFKQHHVTDEEGLIMGVTTTTASTNEITKLNLKKPVVSAFSALLFFVQYKDRS